MKWNADIIDKKESGRILLVKRKLKERKHSLILINNTPPPPKKKKKSSALHSLHHLFVENLVLIKSNDRACTQVCFSLSSIGTVSKATLQRRLRDGVERVWTFPSAYILP